MNGTLEKNIGLKNFTLFFSSKEDSAASSHCDNFSSFISPLAGLFFLSLPLSNRLNSFFPSFVMANVLCVLK